jgi:hypothetical protein
MIVLRQLCVSENLVFDNDLLERMKKLDPNILDILPEIISDIAKAEQLNKDELFKEFYLRTNIDLKQVEIANAQRNSHC